MEGVIEPDTDEPQEMGDFETTEVQCWDFSIFSIKHDFFWPFINKRWRITKPHCVHAFPQVSEEMMDQANEKKIEAIDALGEGGLILYLEKTDASIG